MNAGHIETNHPGRRTKAFKRRFLASSRALACVRLSFLLSATLSPRRPRLRRVFIFGCETEICNFSAPRLESRISFFIYCVMGQPFRLMWNVPRDLCVFVLLLPFLCPCT